MSLFLTSCGDTKTPVRTYNMGEKVVLGQLIYNVFETQWLTQLGEQPSLRLPQHRFFIIRMSVQNSGSSEILAPNLAIQDDKGNTYDEISNGEGVPQWMGFLRQIKPAESAQGNVIFDAPPAHYKLKLADQDNTRVAMVDIPLNFNAETPEIPNPGAARKTDDSPTTLRKPQ